MMTKADRDAIARKIKESSIRLGIDGVSYISEQNRQFS